MRKILLLGGTSEAGALAGCLADRGERAVLSYAGRVSQPKAQPIPTRIGGFGGVPGLVRYLHAPVPAASLRHRASHATAVVARLPGALAELAAQYRT